MKIKKVALFFLFLLVSGCSSSPYTYHVEPTPLSKSDVYEINDLILNLTLGHGAIEGDTTFSDEAALTAQFQKLLNAEMESQGIAARPGKIPRNVSVLVNFERRYNYGGKALNSPVVSGEIRVYDENGVLLASFFHAPYTLNHGVAFNLKIAAFQKSEEDELRDIEFIASSIVSDLKALGK